MRSLSQMNTGAAEQIQFVDSDAFGVVFDRTTPTNPSIVVSEASTFELPTGINLVSMSEPETAEMEIEIDLSVLTEEVTLTFPEGLPAGVEELEVDTNIFAYRYIRSAGEWNIVATPTIELPSGVSGDGLEVVVAIDYTTLDSTAQSLEYTVELTIQGATSLETPSTVTYTPTEINFDPQPPQIIALENADFTYTMTPSIAGVVKEIRTNPSDSATDATVGIFDGVDDSFSITGTKSVINDHLVNIEVDFTNFNPNFIMKYTLANNDDSSVQRANQRFNSPEGYGEVDGAFDLPTLTITRLTGIEPSFDPAFTVSSPLGIRAKTIESDVSATTTVTATNEAIRYANSTINTSAGISCIGRRVTQETQLTVVIPTNDSYAFIARDYASGVGNTSIDWGDGTTTSVPSNTFGVCSHTYTAGTYTIKIEGIYHIDFQQAVLGVHTKLPLTKAALAEEVVRMEFTNCVDLTDAGDVYPSGANWSGMFGGCNSFNQDISHWHTDSVTDMSDLFTGCDIFNQDISAWDTSSVTNMESMFGAAFDFNQDITGWDTSSVTDMSYMFQGTIFRQDMAFNQSIGNWDTSSVTNMKSMFNYNHGFNTNINDLDTSSVTNMERMFWNAASFNKPIGNWDTSLVTNMDVMFSNATSFDQDISSWCVENISQKPTNFDVNTPSTWTTAEKPSWGTPCT